FQPPRRSRQLGAPQQRSAIGERVHGRSPRRAGGDPLRVHPGGGVEISAGDREERYMPPEMAVERALARVRRHPFVEEGGALVDSPALVAGGGEGGGGVGAWRVGGEGPIHELPAALDASRLDGGERVQPEEPPVVAVVRGQRVEKGGELLLAVEITT